MIIRRSSQRIDSYRERMIDLIFMLYFVYNFRFICITIPTGMSVTAGRFFGNQVSYVAGAPRSNGTGQIVFFTKIKTGDSQMRVQAVLSGEQFASSYGYEVANADLNGDG